MARRPPPAADTGPRRGSPGTARSTDKGAPTGTRPGVGCRRSGAGPLAGKSAAGLFGLFGSFAPEVSSPICPEHAARPSRARIAKELAPNWVFIKSPLVAPDHHLRCIRTFRFAHPERLPAFTKWIDFCCVDSRDKSSATRKFSGMLRAAQKQRAVTVTVPKSDRVRQPILSRFGRSFAPPPCDYKGAQWRDDR